MSQIMRIWQIPRSLLEKQTSRISLVLLSVGEIKPKRSAGIPVFIHLCNFLSFQGINIVAPSNAEVHPPGPAMYQLDIVLKKGNNLAIRDRTGMWPLAFLLASMGEETQPLLCPLTRGGGGRTLPDEG